MKRYLATAVVLLVSTGATWAQTVIPCSETDPQADASGTCPETGPVPNAPNVLSLNPPSVDPNTILVNPAGMSAITRPPTSRGIAPLIVPNDPLGSGISNPNPFGGGSTGSTGGMGGGRIRSGVSSPAIR